MGRRLRVLGFAEEIPVQDCDLVDVGTTSQDLQTAAASNYADLIVIIPEHYVDDLAAAFTSDSAVPELQMVTSFTGAYGSPAKLQVEDFLNLTRMTALADAASSGSSVSVASLNAAAGSVIADLTGNADATRRSPSPRTRQGPTTGRRTDGTRSRR